ncbi:MAG TPA: hypothetical protein VFH66_02285 [Mycobacteriales bacterium]|nr:hypothetical protein [Mycobacteriales bacterium]
MHKLFVRRALAAASSLVMAAAMLDAAARADQNEGTPTVSALAEAHIAVGGLHTCAIETINSLPGAVQCWGSNDQGQLGNGTIVTSTDPVAVVGLDGSDAAHTATAITAGNSHTCALLADTTVKCWGLAANGQVGDGTVGDKQSDLTKDPQRRTPVTVVKDASSTPLSGVIAIAAGGFHTCAIVKDSSGNQTAWCWGDDGAGQLGDGKPGDRSSIAQPVLNMPAGVNVTALALGEFHSCALLVDSTVWCWGANTFDQLGFDPGTDPTKLSSAVPVKVSGVTDDPTNNPVQALTTGYGHACVLLKDNTARCWGENNFGQLGYQTDYESTDTTKNYQAIVPLRTMKPSPTPGVVQHTTHTPSLLDTSQNPQPDGHFTAISAGEFHTCALVDDGTARCWGEGGRGQLGTDPYSGSSNAAQIEDSAFSVSVNGLSGATAITAGGFHTCAAIGSAMKCWGYNFYGQLGSYRAQSSTPVQVTAITGARMVAAGTDFACALLNKSFTSSPAPTTSPTGQPFCWGDNTYGQIGAGLAFGSKTSLRTAVLGISSAGALDAGNGYACAIPAGTSTPQCWGHNADGELGNSSTTDSNVPVGVSGLTTASTVDAGGTAGSIERGNTCSVRSDGKVSCWGHGAEGQLGSTLFADSSVPVTVQENTNGGHLDQTPTYADLSGITAVTSGGFHACALAADATVWCWGENANGQLGDGTTTTRSYAVQVQANPDPDSDPTTSNPLTGVTAIAAGRNFTCAIMSNGHVKCWGADDRGQLGDGGGGDQPLPVDTHVIGTGSGGLIALPPAVSASPATSITAGDVHACVRLDDDSLACWGGNSDGQLGDGSTSDAAQPEGIFGPRSSDVPSTSLPVIRSISASRSNTCVVFVDTTVYCWGDNSRDQLGDGIGAMSVNPVTANLAGSL